MAPAVYSRVAVLGLGLMGGSLGLALRAAHLAETVIGFDARAETGARAVALGALDICASTAAEAVAGAVLVVLAAPVLAERDLLATIAAHLPPDTVVTDLGSTKQRVVEWAQELLPVPSRFVGGHPMAGSERSGIEAARANLFAGAVWCLTPTATTDHAAVGLVADLARRLGAAPRQLDATSHDDYVAAVSHLPLVTAAALVRAVSRGADWPQSGELAAGGFRDTTRVASGDPRMARDICLSNRDALLRALDQYITELAEVRGRIAAGDEAIADWFAEARGAREEWLRRRAE